VHYGIKLVLDTNKLLSPQIVWLQGWFQHSLGLSPGDPNTWSQLLDRFSTD